MRQLTFCGNVGLMVAILAVSAFSFVGGQTGDFAWALPAGIACAAVWDIAH